MKNISIEKNLYNENIMFYEQKYIFVKKENIMIFSYPPNDISIRSANTVYKFHKNDIVRLKHRHNSLNYFTAEDLEFIKTAYILSYLYLTQ